MMSAQRGIVTPGGASSFNGTSVTLGRFNYKKTILQQKTVNLQNMPESLNWGNKSISSFQKQIQYLFCNYYYLFCQGSHKKHPNTRFSEIYIM